MYRFTAAPRGATRYFEHGCREEYPGGEDHEENVHEPSQTRTAPAAQTVRSTASLLLRVHLLLATRSSSSRASAGGRGVH